jgi:hypothetical protein
MLVYIFLADDCIRTIGSIEVDGLPKIGDELVFRMGTNNVVLEVTQWHHFHEAIIKHCYNGVNFIACRLVEKN